MKRLSGTNLNLENNLLMFRLNAPVVIRASSGLSPWWQLEHSVETSASYFPSSTWYQITFPSFSKALFWKLQKQSFVWLVQTCINLQPKIVHCICKCTSVNVCVGGNEEKSSAWVWSCDTERFKQIVLLIYDAPSTTLNLLDLLSYPHQ